MDELIPLFNLSGERRIEREELKEMITHEELEIWRNNKEIELKELEKVYKSGEYLAKEKERIESKMNDLNHFLGNLSDTIRTRKEIMKEIKEELEKDKSKENREKNLFLELKKKVGITREHNSRITSLKNDLEAMVKKLKKGDLWKVDNGY